MHGSLIHDHRISVRYAETDAMGVAHHSSYVAWLEEARIEWLRDRGVRYRDLEEQGLFMPVTKVEIAYRRPFRFDDTLVMRTTLQTEGRCSLRFVTEFRQLGNDAIHASGQVVVTALDNASRPTRLDEQLLRTLGIG